MHAFYLLSLLFANGCWLLVDRKYQLAFFYDWRRVLKTILPALILFLLWDIGGIVLHIFYAGQSKYSLDVQLIKNFPIEEPLFLFLLCYTSLIFWRGLQRYVDVRAIR